MTFPDMSPGSSLISAKDYLKHVVVIELVAYGKSILVGNVNKISFKLVLQLIAYLFGAINYGKKKRINIIKDIKAIL